MNRSKIKRQRHAYDATTYATILSCCEETTGCLWATIASRASMYQRAVARRARRVTPAPARVARVVRVDTHPRRRASPRTS